MNEFSDNEFSDDEIKRIAEMQDVLMDVIGVDDFDLAVVVLAHSLMLKTRLSMDAFQTSVQLFERVIEKAYELGLANSKKLKKGKGLH